MEDEMDIREGFKELVEEIKRRQRRKTILRIALAVSALILIAMVVKYFQLL